MSNKCRILYHLVLQFLFDSLNIFFSSQVMVTTQSPNFFSSFRFMFETGWNSLCSPGWTVTHMSLLSQTLYYRENAQLLEHISHSHFKIISYNHMICISTLFHIWHEQVSPLDICQYFLKCMIYLKKSSPLQVILFSLRTFLVFRVDLLSPCLEALPTALLSLAFKGSPSAFIFPASLGHKSFLFQLLIPEDLLV